MSLSELKDISGIVSDVCVALSALLVGIAGFRGLNQWREEIRFKDKFDVAKKLVFHAREFQEAFRWSRGQAPRDSESLLRKEGSSETPAETSALNEKYARLVRLERSRTSLQEMHHACWELNILNINADELIKPFDDVYWELRWAIDEYFNIMIQVSKFGPALWNEALAEKQFELEKLIYESGEDRLTNEIKEAIENLERKLKKHV